MKRTMIFISTLTVIIALILSCSPSERSKTDVSQAYLKYVNKYPYECGFFDDPLVDKKLKNLLQNSYNTFSYNTTVQVPFKNENNILYFDGIAAHGGGYDEGILAIDLRNGLYHAAIMSNSTVLRLYTENKKELPDIIKTWLDERAEESWQNVQIVEK